MKKYTFSNPKTEEDFITFENKSSCFWLDTDVNNIRFCWTNLNYNEAKRFEKAGIVTCIEAESSEEEYK